jgi:phenylalanine-4-hydroxylase
MPTSRSDGTIDQGWRHYSAQDHAVWQTLFERQTALLPGRACDAFVAGMRQLPLDARQIPDFRALNAVLLPHTGWQIVAVPGLVADDIFFAHLANRRFPAGNFIRSPETLDYLEEPDVFHDVFGHVPMLMNPAMADFIQAYGQGGLRAQKLGVLDLLARVYWYTVEFGLLQQSDGLRIYGAGIASSYTESLFALDSASPHRIRFELPRVMRTRYRIDDFQQSYFVLHNLDELMALAQIDFGPLYAHCAGLPELAPGVLLASDSPISMGTQDRAGPSATLETT